MTYPISELAYEKERQLRAALQEAVGRKETIRAAHKLNVFLVQKAAALINGEKFDDQN